VGDTSRGTAPSLEKESSMAWTKPEFTIVAVTLEVTAYAGTKK
jgi:coenzyme PQQ precursor peptide PqqA